MQSFFSHGKVLLCGEYAVLAGVEALALPVHLGQGLKVWEVPTQGNSKIIWQSLDLHGKSWFDCRIDSEIMHVHEASDDEIAKTLIHIFREIKTKNPDYFDHKTIRLETNVEFNRAWGLGTSSTLVSLLNRWSGANAFALQQAGFGGSGYDVAVGLTGKPLVYWLENEEPNWEPWKLDSNLTNHWYLAFPGHKMNSRESLKSLKGKLLEMQQDTLFLQQLSACIQTIKHPRSIPLLEAMLEMWQALISQYLGIPKAYDDLGIKPSQGGLCKWLGAWGGDVLLVNEKILSENTSVFDKMDIVKWNDFVINK